MCSERLHQCVVRSPADLAYIMQQLCSLRNSFIPSFIPSFHSFIPPFHSFVCSFIRSFICLFNYSSFTQWAPKGLGPYSPESAPVRVLALATGIPTTMHVNVESLCCSGNELLTKTFTPAYQAKRLTTRPCSQPEQNNTLYELAKRKNLYLDPALWVEPG